MDDGCQKMMLFSIFLFPFPFFLHRPSSIVPGPGSGSHLFSCSWAKKQQTTVRSWEATYSTYCRYVPTSTYCSKNVSEAKQDEINNRVPARPPITASQTARHYFLNKWHWFWDQSKEFTIFKVDTHDQDADFLGKALSRQLFFEDNRFHVQGW